MSHRCKHGFFGNALALSYLALLGVTVAFEENDKFCIRTEPMLLADIEKHINPIEGDPHCEVLATTLTFKEKESFVATMCKDHGSTHKEDYHLFKLRNGELTGRTSYREICDGKINPLLAWVPYDMVLQHFAQELDPKERMNYIAKATDVEHEKTELCHFRHSDLVTNISANLFTCVVMIFEDNFYGLDASINVLVELQPLMYEIHNVTVQPWMNVTTSYKTLLGRAALKNTGRERKQIFGSVKYAYVEKVHLNVSSVYGDQLEKLPLLFEHQDAVLELDSDGVGGVNVQTKAYFGRAMDPKTTVKVDVIGQWAEHRQQFHADIYEYFGYGIKRFRHEMSQGDVTFTRIESTEPVFEMPESTHLASVTLHGKDKQQLERLSEVTTEVDNGKVNNSQHHAEWEGEDFLDSPHNSHPYPGFYPYFVVGAIVVAVVLLTAIYGMVRGCGNEDKHKYKLTGV